MTGTTTTSKALAPDEGLRLQSGPGRDLIFKVTGEDTRGAIDYFICEVAPDGGPPLHVHHDQDETLHVQSGRFKVRVGDQEHTVESGGFVYMPRGLPHAFLNLTDQPAELIVVFAPGGGHAFFEELGPATRTTNPDRAAIAALRAARDVPPRPAAQRRLRSGLLGSMSTDLPARRESCFVSWGCGLE